MTENRYDVVYAGIAITIEPHFCRDWEPNESGEFVGCYGTNPNHGYTFEEAKKECIKLLEKEISYWKNTTEESVFS